MTTRQLEPLRITAVVAAPLCGESPKGGWSEEIKPEDSIHTLIAVHTDGGATGMGSVFSNGDLVQAGLGVLEPLFMGENANLILMSGLTVILFLGGWLPPLDIAPFTWIPGPIWFLSKIVVMLFVFIWIRATFPRYRYDQLMRLGWKVFLPLSMFWVVLTGGVLIAFDLVP